MISKASTYVCLLTIASCLTVEALIQSPPRMVKQPSTTELLFRVAEKGSEENTPFIIECEAEAEPPPRYRWIKNGKNFDWQTYDDRISQQQGRGTLMITKPLDEDLGQYQCFAENEWGTATSNSVFVRKAELNSFKDQGKEIVTAKEGDPFKLTCQPPDGWPKPNVYWFIYHAIHGISSINDSRITLDPEGNLWFSNITRNDDSKDFTYTCAASSIARSEFKLGTKFLLNVQQSGISAAQNKREPVLQYVTRKNEVAYRGGDANLYCIFGGTPLPQVEWRKNGAIIRASDRVIQEDYGKRIRIKGVNFEDKGDYTCDVSNGVGSPKSYSINLDILSVPYFNVEPEFQTAAESEDVELRCEAKGIPPPEIKWIYNGKPIAEAPPNRRRIVSSNSIIIKNVVKNDTGNYGCNATNSLGYVYKDVYVNVLAVAPEIVDPPRDTITVSDRNVTLTCNVFGAPRPLVKWLKNGKDITGGHYSIDNKGNLHIIGVTYPDADNYTCFASNKLGIASANASLSVKERTRITDLPEDYEVIVGQQATFRCNAVSDPSLNVRIEWLHKNQLIDFDNEPRFIQTNDDSLTITKAIELDSGTFTCRAKTELDQDIAQATLTVQDVPNAPELVAINCNRKSASITWKPTGDNRAPILRFQIEYNTSFTPDTWMVAYESVPNTANTYDVDLSPWANYTFRVKAYNKVGPSVPSHHSSVCTTQPDVPFKNPDKVEGEGSKPNNLIISWTPMSEIEHNAPRFQYRVSWKRDIPGEDWNSEDIFDWRQTSLEIPDQPTFQPYKLKVVAMNEMGESNVTPVEVVGYSGEDAPKDAPGNLTFLNIVAPDSAILTWNHVSPESVRGHFKGYKIQTWTDGGGENSLRETYVTPETNKSLVRELVPYSKNYARILAYNGHYNGPPSNTLSFETPEGLPGTVQSFEAYQLGSSALFLIWKKPEQPNGILTGYKIIYEKMTKTAAGIKNERVPPITDARQTRCKLANLQPNTKYRVTIMATTRAGEGKPFYIEANTKSGPPLEPERPNFKFTVVPSSEPSLVNVRVTWLPTFDGRSGSHFYVQYKEKGEATYESSDPELNEDYIILRGLKSGKIYEIAVVAVDGDYQTVSVPQEVDTGLEGPIIKQQENVATAGWFIGMMLAIAFLLLVLILVCVIKRNRGGKYDVHDRELANGRRDYPDEGGFHEYSQPLDNKSRHSMSSGLKPGHESDTDSMAEYGEGETAGMNEDGSFIGQYGRKRKVPPGSGQPDSASQAFATLV